MMKLHDVLLKAMAKKITWWEAAEIIGVRDRTMRRWRERLEEVEPSRMRAARETERTMKRQDVIRKAMARRLTRIEAPGDCRDERAQHAAHARQNSYHRLPLATAEKVLALYRDNVRHFHEKLKDVENIHSSTAG